MGFYQIVIILMIIIAVSFFGAGWSWRGNYEKRKRGEISKEEKAINEKIKKSNNEAEEQRGYRELRGKGKIHF